MSDSKVHVSHVLGTRPGNKNDDKTGDSKKDGHYSRSAKQVPASGSEFDALVSLSLSKRDEPEDDKHNKHTMTMSTRGL